MTTLEAIGVLLAIVQFPKFFKKPGSGCQTDKSGMVWDLLNTKAKEELALRSQHLMVYAYLVYRLVADHQARMQD
jgi:hypothetical protein